MTYIPSIDSFILFYYKYCKDFYDKCLISEWTNHFSKCPQGQTCLKKIVIDNITFQESGYKHCQMVNGQFVLNHEGTGGIQELETHLYLQRCSTSIICITDRMFRPHTQSYVVTWSVLPFGCNLIHLTHLWSFPTHMSTK